MSAYDDLPFELREMIIVYALYRDYTPFEPLVAAAKLKLGQQTLKALRLTSRRCYVDTITASREWLDYEMIDLFEQLEETNTRLEEHFEGLKSPWEPNLEELLCDNSWISREGLALADGCRRRLDQSEYQVWRRLSNLHVKKESTNHASGLPGLINGQVNWLPTPNNLLSPPRYRGFRQKQLIVEFGASASCLIVISPDIEQALIADARRKWKDESKLPEYEIAIPSAYWWRPHRRVTRVEAPTSEPPHPTSIEDLEIYHNNV